MNFSIGNDVALAFGLLFTRAAAMTVVLPQMLGVSVPVRIRLLLATLLAGALMPRRRLAAPAAGDALAIVVMVLREVAVGMGLSFAAAVVVGAVTIVGELVGTSMELNSGAILRGGQLMPNPLADGLATLAGLLFFVAGFHRALLLGLGRSLAVAPLGALTMPDPGTMIALGGRVFAIALANRFAGAGSPVRAVDGAGSDRAARSANQHTDRRAGGDGLHRAGAAGARRARSRRRRSCTPGSRSFRNHWDGSMGDGPMADREEKTFPALPQNRVRAREQGRIARSRDLTSAVSFLAATAIISGAGVLVGETVLGAFRDALSATSSSDLGAGAMLALRWPLCLVLATGGLLAAASVIGAVAQEGVVFTAAKLVPDLTRLNPLKYFRRIFSSAGLVEIAKATFKIVLIALIAWKTAHWALAAGTKAGSVSEILVVLRSACSACCYGARSLALVVAAGDYAHKRYEHEAELRMTRQEFLDELKQEKAIR